MSRKRPNRLWIAAMLAIATAIPLGSPAAATHGGVHPTFRSERVYFHCSGATKVQNVNYLQSGPASWNTTAPAQSYTAGAGCGHLDAAVYGTQPSTPYDVVYQGTFTGNIASMSFELHNLLLSQVRSGGDYDVGLRVSIDGEQLFGDGTTQGAQITMTPVISSTGLTEKITFSVHRVGCAREVVDANGNVTDVITRGVATEDGDGEIEHEIMVTIDQWYLDRAAGWVWDAAEIPAGITFNPATLEAAKAQPDNPATC